MTAIREFQESDADKALILMRELAKFEGYLDDFAVTTLDLIENGLGPRRRFTAFVAPSQNNDALLGIAVTYIIPWTFDLKPILVLKELFVAETARGERIGESLFQHVIDHGRQHGASKVQWTVLKTNIRAKTFYCRQGGGADTVWENWHLSLASPDPVQTKPIH